MLFANSLNELRTEVFSLKSIFLKIFAVCCVLFVFIGSVQAKVYTSGSPKGNGIFIMGNSDFYPIEYYNGETEKFDGVIPKMLEDISKECGLDFVYIPDSGKSLESIANGDEIDIISSHIIGSGDNYIKDEIMMISYRYKNKDVNIGLGFTKNADEELIGRLKTEIVGMSESEKSGYLITATQQQSHKKENFALIFLLSAILVLVIIIFVLYMFKNSKKLVQESKLTDEETGTGNLAWFEREFKNIPDYLRNTYRIAYVILDSEYLRVYHGESILTDTIKYTAGVLASYVNQDEIVARITENGFVFVFKSENEKQAENIIQKISDELDVFIAKETDEKRFYYMAVYKLDKKDKSSEFLLFNLRKKCSELIGGDAHITYCDDNMLTSAVEEKEMVESIKEGLLNQEFELYLQFIVDNENKKVVSAEALSRWQHKEKGIILPGAYIGAMESAGLITQFDYYMFEMVCRQLHKWAESELEKITISCNFTRITISEEDFAERIREISGRYVFNKKNLIIEITEDSIENNREKAMENIFKCKEMGFCIALDDLGSGYTSLANLCEYPIDIVKLDRSIILKTDKKNGRELLNGTIALGHNLNLKVVCEGVETEEQNTIVSDSKCDYIQGWYYFKALPEKEYEKIAMESL